MSDEPTERLIHDEAVKIAERHLEACVHRFLHGFETGRPIGWTPLSALNLKHGDIVSTPDGDCVFVGDNSPSPVIEDPTYKQPRNRRERRAAVALARRGEIWRGEG